MMLRIFCVAAAGVIACSHARAAGITMPINFIGEWCYSSQENKTTSCTLPSWTEDGRCTKILSIDQYGFFGEGRHCEPVNMRPYGHHEVERRNGGASGLFELPM